MVRMRIIARETDRDRDRERERGRQADRQDRDEEANGERNRKASKQGECDAIILTSYIFLELIQGGESVPALGFN